MNIGTKILHLVLEEEVIFFVKLVWEELLEAKSLYSFLPSQTPASFSVMAILATFGHQGARLITQPKLRDSKLNFCEWI